MITRRTFIAGTAAAAAGAAFLPPLPTWARSRNFTPIRRGVGTFAGRGGTIGWLVATDALVVVDTQFPESAQACRTGLAERSDRVVDVLVNTHHHGDHTAGNAVFAPEAKVFVAHENVPGLQQASAQEGSEPSVASTVYSDSWRQDVGDEVLVLTHLGPAHTGGDSVVYFEKADVVHMGDLVFNRMPPFIDRPGGASIEGWIGLLETVHGMYTDDTVFVHGHGNPNYGVVGTREDLLVMRDFLSGLLDYVRGGLSAGQSIETLASVDRLPDFPEHYAESWAAAIPNAIRVAHQELTN